MSLSEDRGRKASVDGFAHEHIVVGILMKKYQNVSLVDLPLSPYDIIIVFKDNDESEQIIRGQVKTATKSISFTGGSRGGVDRTYKSGIKTYVQSPKTSDVIIGIHPREIDSFDLYFLPTILIDALHQSSISINKAVSCKNNYDLLEHSKDPAYVLAFARKVGLIK